MKTVRLIIKGKVQGVFYRATAKDVADLTGVKGWVKNLPDNNVEITATATEETLQKFINWCKIGPSRSVVTEVITDMRTPENFEKFKIRRG